MVRVFFILLICWDCVDDLLLAPTSACLIGSSNEEGAFPVALVYKEQLRLQIEKLHGPECGFGGASHILPAFAPGFLFETAIPFVHGGNELLYSQMSLQR